MTNFFQQPMIPSTQPAPEPPGFDLLRQMLMQKSFGLNSNPYGLNPSYKGGASDVYTNGQNQGFNPYQNGGQSGGGMGGGRRPHGMGGGMPQGGGMGSQGGQGGPPAGIMQLLQQMMSQMKQGGQPQGMGGQQSAGPGGSSGNPMEGSDPSQAVGGRFNQMSGVGGTGASGGGAAPDRSRTGGFDGSPRTMPMRSSGGGGMNPNMLMQLFQMMKQQGGGFGGGQRDQEMPPGYNPGPKGTFGMAGGGPQGGGGFGGGPPGGWQNQQSAGPGGSNAAPQEPSGPFPGMGGRYGGGGFKPPEGGGNQADNYATPPAQSPDRWSNGSMPQDSGPPPAPPQSGVPDRSRMGFDGMTHYDGDGCTGASFDGDPYSGWQPGRYSTPQSIKPKDGSDTGGGTPDYIPPDQTTSAASQAAGGFTPSGIGQPNTKAPGLPPPPTPITPPPDPPPGARFDGRHQLGNRMSAAPRMGGASGGMRQLAPLMDALRPSRGPSPSARIGKPLHGIEPGLGMLR